jgi:hypothetical protein
MRVSGMLRMRWSPIRQTRRDRDNGGDWPLTANPMPKAKTERLIVREIDGETLVYDRSRDGASC